MYEIIKDSKGTLNHGISACAGCGMELLARCVFDVLGEDIIIVIPPGCAALLTGMGAECGIKAAGMMCNLENTASTCSGIRASLDSQGNDHTTVVGFAGDGGTLDIGLQSLSGMIERGDKVLYICYDNEAYMNTGIQSSSATPFLASTTTQPAGKPTVKKDLVGIAMAHDIPYAATASLHNIADLKKKIQKAKDTDGPSLIHVLIPCPTGWRSDPADTITLARAAVNTGVWVLYEYENGEVTVNYKPKELKPIEEYISLQGRFKKVTEEEKAQMQKIVKQSYERKIAKLEK
ncbi:MAG: pyruvate synthase subunit beta [Eubacteriaceae bacterium]|nr:pyruvate synthase subunit beta [Eubacteriaceae bacterium]